VRLLDAATFGRLRFEPHLVGPERLAAELLRCALDGDALALFERQVRLSELGRLAGDGRRRFGAA
jgi:hypothetical protein